MQKIVTIIVLFCVVGAIGFYIYNQDITEPSQEITEVDEAINYKKVVEEKKSDGSFVRKYISTNGKLKIRATFSSEDYGSDNLLKEEWFDKEGTLFKVGTKDQNGWAIYKILRNGILLPSEQIKRRKWHSNENLPVEIKCETNTLGTISIKKDQSEFAKIPLETYVLINNQEADVKYQGSGICRYGIYNLTDKGVNIIYWPDAGCSNNEYSPELVLGTVYLNKDPNFKDRYKDRGNYYDFHEEAIEWKFCH